MTSAPRAEVYFQARWTNGMNLAMSVDETQDTMTSVKVVALSKIGEFLRFMYARLQPEEITVFLEAAPRLQFCHCKKLQVSPGKITIQLLQEITSVSELVRFAKIKKENEHIWMVEVPNAFPTRVINAVPQTTDGTTIRRRKTNNPVK